MTGPEGPFHEDSENLRANDELDAARTGEFHTSNLYDQNEDKSGEKFDLATGKPIRNDTDLPPGEGLTEVQGGDSEDALGALPADPEDPAEKWLRENDPAYRKRREK